jgi:hypothetical protein
VKILSKGTPNISASFLANAGVGLVLPFKQLTRALRANPSSPEFDHLMILTEGTKIGFFLHWFPPDPSWPCFDLAESPIIPNNERQQLRL